MNLHNLTFEPEKCNNALHPAELLNARCYHTSIMLCETWAGVSAVLASRWSRVCVLSVDCRLGLFSICFSLKNLSAFCLCETIITYFNVWSVNKDTGLCLVFILSCFTFGLYFCRHMSHTVGLCEGRWPQSKYQTFYLFNLIYFVLP